MSKFSKEFKFRVVQEYLNSSVGIGQLARKYGIKSDVPFIDIGATFAEVTSPVIAN